MIDINQHANRCIGGKTVNLRGELIMVNTKILLSVVIVVLIGVTAAGYQINSQNPGFWQPTTTSSNTQSSGSGAQPSDSGTTAQTTAGTSTGTTGTTGTEVYSSGSSGQTGGSNVISASAAKSAAASAIAEPGATTGKPKLSSDRKYYTVPVLRNGKTLGAIEVNAQTGEVTGGYGNNA